MGVAFSYFFYIMLFGFSFFYKRHCKDLYLIMDKYNSNG